MRFVPPVLLALGVSVSIFMWTQKPVAADTVTINSIGGKWDVSDVHWQNFNGAWMLNATTRPASVSLNKTRGTEIARALCGAMLTNDTIIGLHKNREDVFRVNLRVFFPEKNGSERDFFKGIAPIHVVDGACNATRKTLRSANYPAPMEAWHLDDVKVVSKSGGRVAALIFEVQEKDVQDGFDYALACDYALADPVALASLALAHEKGAAKNTVRIEARRSFKSFILKMHKGGFKQFKVSSGKCSGGAQVPA